MLKRERVGVSEKERERQRDREGERERKREREKINLAWHIMHHLKEGQKHMTIPHHHH